jgi:hypothetical protein
MTEPSPARPVPGPPRPGPGPGSAAEPPAAERSSGGDPTEQAGEERFADLDDRPVAEHVTVFEAEHDRLQRELGTIDQL